MAITFSTVQGKYKVIEIKIKAVEADFYTLFYKALKYLPAYLENMTTFRKEHPEIDIDIFCKERD